MIIIKNIAISLHEILVRFVWINYINLWPCISFNKLTFQIEYTG